MIEQFARLIPRNLLDESGSVFYSGRNAFSKPNNLYILGLNPGGEPNDRKDDSIRLDTEEILRGRPDNWSEYRDGEWENKPPGKHGMQPRILHLLRKLNLDPGTVPASNIAFLRSSQEKSFKGDIYAIAEECWPLHQAVISELGVTVILCFGRTAGAWVRYKVGADKKISEFVEKNKRKWRSKIYTNSNDILVADFTHPSRANWVAPDTDPSELMLDIVSELTSR